MVSSRMFEGYCADIESLVRGESLRPALRLALALPDICTALEDPAATSSGESYAAWCASWAQWEGAAATPGQGERLFEMYARRASRGGPPNASHSARALDALRKRRAARAARASNRARLWHAVGRFQTFEVAICEALLNAARRWYTDVGARSAVVQRNLGVLAVMR